MGIEKVIESYRKPLELIKEGIGNFYRYRHWHFKEKKSELQTTLEKFWANNLKAPKEKKGKK